MGCCGVHLSGETHVFDIVMKYCMADAFARCFVSHHVWICPRFLAARQKGDPQHADIPSVSISSLSAFIVTHATLFCVGICMVLFKILTAQTLSKNVVSGLNSRMSGRSWSFSCSIDRDMPSDQLSKK